MTLLDEQYALRDTLVDRLENDLVGPGGGPDELLSDPPITHYAAGILFPNSTATIEAADDLDDEPLEGGAEVGNNEDPAVILANTRYPSSMGLTFAVDQSCPSISVEISTARYEPIDQLENPGATEDSTTKGRRSASRARPASKWQRRPVVLDPITLPTDAATTGEQIELTDGLSLFLRIRAPDALGHVSVTLILLNSMVSISRVERDASSWFQPVIHVRTEGRPGIVHRPGPEPPDWDEDLRSYRLLYRHCTSMGTGHGCALTWPTDLADPTRVDKLSTTFVPRYELLLSDSNPDISVDSIGMKAIARGARAKVLDGLGSFCSGYGKWVDGQANAVTALSPKHQDTALAHVANCRSALERMKNGIARLESDDDAWLAFQLTNEAMLRQRARGVWLREGKPTPEPILDDSHTWRPFQIAFMLLCLEGIIDGASEDRDLADLLWFPTGGGKTEAYLGLLSFAIVLRRLRDSEHGQGVTVLMRYTLRLLTIQQFERAALLICCLESLRRSRNDLGDEPISIGLWVGRAATPNTLAETKRAIDKLRGGNSLAEGNPLQLQRCPWCGSGLDSRNLYVAKSRPRLVITCRTDDCEFDKELPVHVIDEDIYKYHPSLIIATADKFASLPWRENCRSLFNLDLHETAPPALIIQDELHLISGPLGTLAGLYETAIDFLCTQAGIRPKVVASTATIRRAGPQTAGLFDREVRQFPPPALDGRDSYFAVETPRERRGSRMYVGCMAPATSQTSLMVRVYAALLQGAADEVAPDEVKDPYWTLVGYFNSLRILGGARMQVQDDVNDRLELLANSAETQARQIPVDNRIELTSREPSSSIPDHLRRMANALPGDSVLDVILATNMISVGVDIDRLGLMAVMGQPQSTSEYIQATSRVGRRHPGLVVVMFNGSKSRDRSHYESFTDYHAALYRQVESTSVTPFSPRARDRALHSVLIALARATIPDLRANDSAADIAKVEDQVRTLAHKIVERVEHVDPGEAKAVGSELEEVIADWISRATEEHDLVFRNSRHPDLSLLGDAATPDDELEGAIPTLWSLRDVDQSSNLYQVS